MPNEHIQRHQIMPPFYTRVSVTSSDGGLYSSIQLAKAIYPHKSSVEYKFDNVATLKMNNIAMHYKRFPKFQVIPIEEYTNSIYNSNWEQSEVRETTGNPTSTSL